MQFNSATMQVLMKGIGEIPYMVFLSSTLSYVIGIPSGIVLAVMDKNGISPVPLLNKALGLVINVLRSIPFIVPPTMVVPITRMIAGKIISCNATAMPLVIAMAPYTGRMVESSLKEVDAGTIEAVKSTGVSTWQITVRVLLPEVRSSLLVGTTISVTTTLGYSAMVDFTGGGGPGDIAIRYGYHRYQADIMMVTVVLLIIIVQLIQEVFMRMFKKGDKRVR